MYVCNVRRTASEHIGGCPISLQKDLKGVGGYDALQVRFNGTRHTITFPATFVMAGTKLYCLVTEAHVCEQLCLGMAERRSRDLLTAASPMHAPIKATRVCVSVCVCVSVFLHGV